MQRSRVRRRRGVNQDEPNHRRTPTPLGASLEFAAMYVVILAGGGGTRLRPLSRDERPKPFLPLLDERTLIQQTVDRLPHGLSGVFAVVSPAYAPLVRGQVPDVEVLVEPEGRNTAAAIALATLAIDRPADEIMAVLPADHAIRDASLFQATLRAVADRLAGGALGVDQPLVTLGVRVERPSTEYGYLIPEPPGALVDGLSAFRLRAFREKPDAAAAQGLYRQGGGIAWNAGMFLWRRAAIRRALADYTDLVATLEPVLQDAGALAGAYAGLRTRSIDYEVMEPAARDGRVLMASMDVGWSDIGGWTALLAQLGAAGEGRVLPPGESADIASGDLAIQNDGGRLVIRAGPSTIHSDGPVALLTGAAADRDRIERLLARVAAREAHEA